MSTVCYTRTDTPLGPLLLVGDGEALLRISFLAGTRPLAPDPAWAPAEAPFREAVAQLGAYFAGRLRRFELPLRPAGTPFQQGVWRALREIPYGETRSYGELARAIGRPTASRAVGAANGRNPLPIVVPCHRVIGADGRLTGFASGLPIKEALLDLERRHARPGDAPRSGRGGAQVALL